MCELRSTLSPTLLGLLTVDSKLQIINISFFGIKLTSDFNALVELVLGFYFVVGVVDLEPLRIKRMQLYLWVVNRVFEGNCVLTSRAPKGILKADLNHVSVDEQAGLD